MNRRNFLKFLSAATVGSTVAYSFPSVIVPKNIISVETIIPVARFSLDEINRITREEIFPKLIRDNFFSKSPFLAYLEKKHEQGIVAHSLGEAVQIVNEADDRLVKIDTQINQYYKELQSEIDKRLH